MSCSDIDADSCDDCSQGQFDVFNDGLDTDGDGQCNLGDNDDDGDTVVDEVDNCPVDVNVDQEDEDINGVGDACEVITQSTDSICMPIRAANDNVAVICL